MQPTQFDRISRQVPARTALSADQRGERGSVDRGMRASMIRDGSMHSTKYRSPHIKWSGKLPRLSLPIRLQIKLRLRLLVPVVLSA